MQRAVPCHTSSPRHLAPLALLFAAVALSACGGGGGGSATPAPAATPTPSPSPPSPAPGPTTPPSSPSPSPAAAYFVYGPSGPGTMNVVDPATPATVALSSPYTAVANVLSTVAISTNAAAGTYTRLGEPLLFFVRDQQLFQVALAKPGTPTAVRVSAQTDVCQLDAVAQLDHTGQDAWVVLRTAGPDGDCAAPADNRQAFVRAGASATTAATVLPANVWAVANGAVADSSGQLLWMLVNDRSTPAAPKLVAFRPDLAQVDVAGGAGITLAGGVSVAVPGSGPVLANGVFLRADQQLRRLTGDANALSLEAASHSFTSVSSGLGMVDGSTLYFPDANRLMKVTGTTAAVVLATLPTASGTITSFSQTANRIVVQQVGAGGAALSSVNKADGSVVALRSGGSGSILTPAALDGEALYYYTDRGDGSTLRDLRRMQADGTADTLVSATVFAAGGVLRTSGRLDFTQFFFGAPVSLLSCSPAAGAADCRNGSLNQLALASQALTTLGSFTGSSASSWAATAQGWDGLAGARVTVSAGSTASDLWLANPGQASSLTRVTNNLP